MRACAIASTAPDHFLESDLDHAQRPRRQDRVKLAPIAEDSDASARYQLVTRTPGNRPESTAIPHAAIPHEQRKHCT